jgi:hypothetical protein
MSKRIARVKRIEAKRPRVAVAMTHVEADNPAAREHVIRFLAGLLDRIERGEA